MKRSFVVCAFLVSCVFARAADSITYEQFGAVGDGKSDDFAAIVKAHAEANAKGLPVRVADGKAYYIGGADLTAEIATDTDFGTAKFIIDDTKVERVKASVFRVVSKSAPISLPRLKSLASDAKNLGLSLAAPSLVEIVDDKVKRYIRKGRNHNAGEPQQEVLLVAVDGTIDVSTPMLWDYPEITKLTAYPVDAKPLVVKGGVFVTIANQAESKYNYYSRGIEVNRSNVTLDGIRHDITGEGDHGAPYRGFVSVIRAANVTVKDCVFTAHRTYNTIGAAKKPVPMGSYDLHANSSVNVRILNSRQTTDITDRKYWGLFASNYCKGLLFDGCSFSRFDAHMGVANAMIRNSTLGHMGINAIGFGTFLVENTTVIGDSFFNLRKDYGSTWDGEFIVRNSRLKPKGNVVLVSGCNDETHDFGYPCRMPRKITFDGFEIQDAKTQGKLNPALFSDINPSYKENSRGPFSYAVTEEVVLKDVRVASGRELVVSANPLPFAKLRGIGSVTTAAEVQAGAGGYNSH